MDKFIKESY